jgi:hypothetical protein
MAGTPIPKRIAKSTRKQVKRQGDNKDTVRNMPSLAVIKLRKKHLFNFNYWP